MKVYRYYCQFRPPMPGAIPRDGLVNIGDYDYPQSFDGISAWGFAEYNRPLTDKEISDYELVASRNNPLGDKSHREYKGYVIEYIPQDKFWAVTSTENPQLGVIAYCDTQEEAIEGIDGLMMP